MSFVDTIKTAADLIACNCGDTCTNTCTHAELLALITGRIQPDEPFAPDDCEDCIEAAAPFPCAFHCKHAYSYEYYVEGELLVRCMACDLLLPVQ